MILEAKIVYLGNQIYSAICVMKDGTILKSMVEGRYFDDAKRKIILNWKQNLWKAGKNNFERGSLQFYFTQINLTQEITESEKVKEEKIWLVKEENGKFETIRMNEPLMTETEAKTYIVEKMFGNKN